jgi:PRTRC genetic system protein C
LINLFTRLVQLNCAAAQEKTMQITTTKRVFVHNGARLADPDTVMSPASVKDLFSAMYPELLNAEIQGPEVEGAELVYTFHRTTGTKGASVKLVHALGPLKEKSSFARRLDTAADETVHSIAVLPPSKLNKLHALMKPMIGGQPLSLPSSSFALLL